MTVSRPTSRPVSLSKLGRLIRTLDLRIPVDDPTTIIRRTSEKGFQGFRVQGTTQSLPWYVDLFGGNFYLVKVHGLEVVQLSSLPQVYFYLKSKLPKVP